MSAKREGKKQQRTPRMSESVEKLRVKCETEPWKLDSDKYPVDNIHNHGEWINDEKKTQLRDQRKITENEPDKNLSGANDQ